MKTAPRSKSPRQFQQPLRNIPEIPGAVLEIKRKLQEWQESYRAGRMDYIHHLCRRIAQEFHPERVILFGSHAYGQPTPASDLDLLVVMPFEGGYFHQAARIRQHLDLPIPLGLLVRTPEQLQHRIEMGDSFMQEIVTRGKVMYEADHD